MILCLASIVGGDQILAREGPQFCTPAAVLVVGCGSSATEYVFQICFPVTASSATTPPREVQHSYLLPRPTSSPPVKGTNTRPSRYSCDPTILARGCESTCTFHNNSPVTASNAYAIAF